MKSLDIEKILQDCPLTNKLKNRSQLLGMMIQYIYSDKNDEKPSVEDISRMIVNDEILKSPCIIVTHDDLLEIIRLALIEAKIVDNSKE